jgi:hypothetical protein
MMNLTIFGGHIEIISRHLPVRTEENYEEPQVRVAVVSMEIRNKNLPN